jgi:alpha,alpha-trehalose phosphorylase
VHVASAGGVWTALVSGFGGMRDHYGELTFDPRLPAGWENLSFRLQWHGTPVVVDVTADEITFEVGEGEDVPLCVRGVDYVAAAGQTLRVALDGQGPHFPGHPTRGPLAGARRADGTLLSASVPTLTATIPVISDDDEELG